MISANLKSKKRDLQKRIAQLEHEIDNIRNGAMDNGNYSTVQIGRFRLSRVSRGKIWISFVDDAEGGEFKEKAVSDAIGKFYAENF